ncbi:hypothetical protein ASPCADRAFT_207686 [Aspergillus carbonarius ITEM 5010]|uniref:Secreted protein n=1 Tax=Aspergillus carbonarius (strain ITEM 5010) TaxID=602072 RepID=A0A1R3RL46_ASPC5|nr:hypothetical protein ASPCADRAFT_207686 [Aspergillus carbonarius ITEM 5010]
MAYIIMLALNLSLLCAAAAILRDLLECGIGHIPKALSCVHLSGDGFGPRRLPTGRTNQLENILVCNYILEIVGMILSRPVGNKTCY